MLRGGFNHGFSDDAWDAAKAQAKAILQRVARRRSLIAYSDLAAMITQAPLEPHDRRFFHFLGEISSEEDEAGRGLLTVLVVHKSGDMKPGPGFFELAGGRGRDVSDPEQCWVQELHNVYATWERPR
jgi:hypothetical protein